MIKYIAFYDNCINAAENRYVVASCQSKLEYIVDVLQRNSEQIEIISPSLTKNRKGFYKKKKYNINESVSVSLPATRGFHTLLGKAIRRLWQNVATNIFVFKSINEGELVIAYHSIALSKVLIRLKKKKNIKLLMHVEEIYSDVSGNRRTLSLEERVFSIADGYLFPTEMLNARINKQGKPFAISYGDYNMVNRVTKRFDDGLIHCVYAGTFDTTKGGCEIAIKAAQYLDQNYCIHIIGFGNKNEIQHVENLISELNNNSGCKVIYDGEKRGEQFKEYIQKCHIGLSTQNPDAKYNNSSFPSKVLTYLVNGLAVVSVRITVLECSKVSNLLTYYDGSKPEAVANAIKQSANTSMDINIADCLMKLDQDFSVNLQKLIELLAV